jgi:hypothetical protein
MGALDLIRIDPRSTVGKRMQKDLQELSRDGALTVEAVACVATLAVARLEACLFGALDDPVVGDAVVNDTALDNTVLDNTAGR